MLSEYGFPPAIEDCKVVAQPERLVTKANQAFLTPVVSTPMVPGALGRRLPPSAIAHQLVLLFEGKPVIVEVGNEVYRVSSEGWSVSRRGVSE